MVQGLPLPLLKICDFGYSKAHFMSAPKSKVGTCARRIQYCLRLCRVFGGISFGAQDNKNRPALELTAADTVSFITPHALITQAHALINACPL
jgi:hypothetical protein